MFMNERREIDEVFFKQEPILQHNLPVEILGDPPPPKGDLVFELKPLTFDIVPFRSGYHALLGHTSFAKFNAVPHYA